MAAPDTKGEGPITITLNLLEDLAARLTARPDANQFAAAVLADALDAEEVKEYDFDAAVEGIRRGFAALDAGKVRSLEDFAAEREEARRQRGASKTGHQAVAGAAGCKGSSLSIDAEIRANAS